jgi:hypothetical protein
VPVQILVDIASDIQDLIAIAVGRRAAFDGLSLRHPDVYREALAVRGLAAKPRYPRPITEPFSS